MLTVQPVLRAKASQREIPCTQADIELYDVVESRDIHNSLVEFDIQLDQYVTARVAVLLYGFEFEGWATVRFEPTEPREGYPQTMTIKRLRIAAPGNGAEVGANVLVTDLDTGMIVPFQRITARQESSPDILIPVVSVPFTKEEAFSEEMQRRLRPAVPV